MKTIDSLAGFRKDKCGASAVEFAIVSPVLLYLLFGFIAYGIYFGALHSVQQLAADAARVSVAGLDDAERKKLVDDYIAANAGDYVLLDSQFLTHSAAPSDADAGQFRVSVTYDAAQLPIWSLYGGLPLPGKTIARTSTIRLGGV